MKKKRKSNKITEKDYILANRRASRTIELESHGRLISGRTFINKSKKRYDRKKMKKVGDYESKEMS